MKAKKLFALLLSVCMIASAFVSVSAKETVYKEGTAKTIVDVSYDFDSENADILKGAGFNSTPSLVADPASVRQGQVMKLDVSAGDTGYVGFEVTCTDGYKLPTLKKGDVVDVKCDIYSENGFTVGDSGGTAGILMRTGVNWAPTDSWVQVASPNKVVPAGEWTAIDNKFVVGADVIPNGSTNDGSKMYLQVRPNAAGVFYIDNLSLKITVARDTVLKMDLPMTSSGLEKGGDVSVDYTNGYALATMTSTGNNAMVGTRLLNSDGSYLTVQNGDIIKWSVDVMPQTDWTMTDGGSGTRNFILRTGGSNFPPSGDWKAMVQRTDAAGTKKKLTGGQWNHVEGMYVVPTSGFSVTGSTAFCIRREKAETIGVKNLKIEVQRPTVMTESGWQDVDYSIPHAKQLEAALRDVGTLVDNTSSFTVASVASKITGGSWNGYINFYNVLPNAPLAKDGNWKLSFDVERSGFDNTDAASVQVRCFDNTANETMGYTVGFLEGAACSKADGTTHYEFTSADLKRVRGHHHHLT